MGSDKLEFRFFDKNGNVVLDFYQDYISATTDLAKYPSGYASLGVAGGEGEMLSGSAANIVSWTTSLSENLNHPSNLANKAALIVNSPTSLVGGNVVVDPAKAPGGWDYINSYTAVIKGSAFTAGGGFGGVAVPDQHNSPNKLGGPNGMATSPVDSTVVNTATATSGTQTATATASVDIVIPSPTANDDTYAGTEDMAAKSYATVLANDTGPGGKPSTAVLVSGVAHGTLTFNADGTFSYKPVANFNGADSFTYKATNGLEESNVATVTINVAAVKDAPVAKADTYNVTKNTTLTVAAALGVLANDTDIDGLGMTAVVTANVTKGTLAMNADGSFAYTPPNNFTGNVTFKYKAKSNAALLSNEVTVTLVVK